MVKPNDKSEKDQQCGLVHSVKCGSCDREYIGETAKALGTRFKEHMDGNHPTSAVHEHTSSMGHKFTMDNIKILVREEK